MEVRAKKYLGQHFLTDLNVAGRIADTIDAATQHNVLEIGPGMGVLTQFLLAKDRNLKVVEIDGESVDYLKRNFGGPFFLATPIDCVITGNAGKGSPQMV
ncbi:MAG: hypothetical protein II708_02955 [Paludibacteraceae bacterium]|nr:hypothetical protein [Paludibacteraceae bacterium]